MLFMLVKYQSSTIETTYDSVGDELVELQQFQRQLEKEQKSLTARLAQLEHQQVQQEASLSLQMAQEAIRIRELNALKSEAARLEKEVSSLMMEQKNRVQTKSPTPKETQHHLLGIKVEGPRILILVDHSASMSDTHLNDIIRFQIEDMPVKRMAPKWKRTIAIVRWLIEQVPPDSQLMIVHYNRKADFLHGKSWIDPGHIQSRETLFDGLEALYPDEGTNLYEVLQLVVDHRLEPSNIYLVTDGLPTLGPGPDRAHRDFTGCNTFHSKSVTITSACRKALFFSATVPFSRQIPAKVNVILLPLEGDPEAVYPYWSWASATGGILASPVSNWPR